MSPRSSQRWILWLLPLFILRAFVPAGFMWAASANGLEVVLCGGFARTAPSQIADHSSHAEHAAHAHAEHGASHEQHHEGSNEPSHSNPICPFAGAGFGFIETEVASATWFAASVVVAIAPPADPLFDHHLVDHHRIRGPPVSSFS